MTPGGDADPGTWAQVQQFYALQTHLRESGRIETWARTFTADAVMTQHARSGREPPGAGVLRGRVEIASAARATALRRRDSGVTRRFWITTVNVRPDGPERIWTRYVVGLLGVPTHGAPRLLLNASGTDLLVRRGTALMVHGRTLFHDDTPP